MSSLENATKWNQGFESDYEELKAIPATRVSQKRQDNLWYESRTLLLSFYTSTSSQEIQCGIQC